MRQPFCEAARLRLGWSSAGVEGALREGMQLGGVGGEMVRDGEVGDFFEVDGLEVGHLHGRSGGINRGANSGQELYRCRCSRTPPPLQREREGSMVGAVASSFFSLPLASSFARANRRSVVPVGSIK